jgi:hypothetical protein
MRRRDLLLALAIAVQAIVLVLMPAIAEAQRIGKTAVAENDVARLPQATPIRVGDDVVRNETIRTGNNSTAKIVLIDDTNVAIGPNSTLTMDRTVFAGPSSYSKAAVRLSVGAFRFISGNSSKDAYEIRTPVATIGVRGTVVDILIAGLRSIFSFVEGSGQICTSPTNCVEVGPGQSITVNVLGNTVQIVRGDASAFSFTIFCTGGSLCGQTLYASIGPGGTNFGGTPNSPRQAVLDLLARFPNGGPGLTAGIADLLQRDASYAVDIIAAIRGLPADVRRATGLGMAIADKYYVTCMSAIFPPSTATDICRESDRVIRWAMEFADEITIAGYQSAPEGSTSGEPPPPNTLPPPGGGTCVSPSNPRCL